MTIDRFILAIVLLGAVTPGHSQAPGDAARLEHLSPGEAAKLTREWLQNGGPMQHAWAAYWIRRDHQYQEAPELLKLIRHGSDEIRPAGLSDDYSVLIAVLDALIWLHADVPKETTEAIYAEFPAQALVLLSRSGDDVRDVLTRIVDSPQRPIDWLAAADLLAADPPAGFAAKLLKGIAIHAAIQVLSPGDEPPGSGIAGSCGGSTNSGRGGWPPAGLYYLSSHRLPDSDLLADGENAVYVRRTTTDDRTDGCEDMFLDVAVLRRDLIGQLLGLKKDHFELQLNPSLDFTSTTAEAYIDAAGAFVRAQQDILQQTIGALASQGLLTTAEADSARPAFDVSIVDLRRDKTPLPNLVLSGPSIPVIYKAVDPPEPSGPDR